MEIKFDNNEDKELFKVMLDSFLSMSILDDDAQVFINKIHEILK